jgi:hypothetical protein
MSQYRKKPLEIEARLFEGESNGREIARWCGGRFDIVTAGGSDDGVPDLSIPTLEGVMHANSGDWIIRGVQGEFYPCKPDIFAATYEAVPA